jgi:hypothetical protein
MLFSYYVTFPLFALVAKTFGWFVRKHVCVTSQKNNSQEANLKTLNIHRLQEEMSNSMLVELEEK